MSAPHPAAPSAGITTIAVLAGAAPVVTAVVVEFDDAVGVGVLEVQGAGAVDFHCTAIADGTRSIEVGTAVVCSLVAAHHGRVEGAALVTTERPGAAAAAV